jgi:hypothetical protein
MGASATAKVAEGKCSKCEAVLDSEGYPKWCLACRAKNRREYEATKKEMNETRGFSAGSSAMRHAAAEYFKLFGNAKFSGIEIWSMLRSVPGPGEVRQ